MTTFRLHLSDGKKIRMAFYDPFSSRLQWEDTQESIIEPVTSFHHKAKIFPISPTTPGKKVSSLQKIKIQMGFACNFSCSYCSQSNVRDSSSTSVKVSASKVDNFFSSMANWYNGGFDGAGLGTTVEFWGGETLIYWDAVKKLSLLIKTKYPNIRLVIFTNGSLVKKDMVDFAKEIQMQFAVSHDGPTFSQDRSIDPFDIPKQAENLKYLFNTLNPIGLVSFNAAITPKNFSLIKIREYIASKLSVDPKIVALSYDLVIPYEFSGMNYVIQNDIQMELVNKMFNELICLSPVDLIAGRIVLITSEFIDSLRIQKNIQSVGQKCSMDLPTALAVDLDGNVLTCQTVTAASNHKIGHVSNLDDVKLDTSYHFSKRPECIKCPVVHICRGSCMFLTGKLWEASCDQHFTWGLAHFAYAMFLLTDMKLTKIEADAIRHDGVTSLNVIQE